MQTEQPDNLKAFIHVETIITYAVFRKHKQEVETPTSGKTKLKSLSLAYFNFE